MRHSETNKGETILVALVVLASTLVMIMAIATSVIYNSSVLNRETHRALSLQIAESGIDRALWCLNHETECAQPYFGENVNLGAGSYSVSVTAIGNNRQITSTGSAAGVDRTIRITSTDEPATSEASFFYGVQVGEGGLNMDNNATIEGNVYSNGSITSGPGASINGSVIVAGGTELVPDQSQTVQTEEHDVGRTKEEADAAQSFKAGETNVMNKISVYIKKVGSPSNATVRIVTDNAGFPSDVALASGTLDSGLVAGFFDWIDVTFNTTPPLILGTTYWIVIDIEATNPSKYWVWGSHDNSGYGNGVGMFSEDWDDDPWNSANSDFNFKVWMGGVPTSITGLTVPSTLDGSVHANSIQNSTISVDSLCQIMGGTTLAGNLTCGDVDGSTIAGSVIAENVTDSTISGDLTCETESGNTVAGAKNCPTPVDPPIDPPPESMPVSNAQIQQWELDAEIGGVITPPGGPGTTYEASNGETLGPVKIDGDLLITNGANINMNGIVWVKGDFSIDNNAVIQLSPGFGSESSVIVVDNPSFQQTKGKVRIYNNGNILGSGVEGSYIMVASTNKGVIASTDPAIQIENNVSGAIFFTSQGMLQISNNAELKEATGYLLQLDQNVSVEYESGLASTSFTSGPGGIWRILPETWEEL